VTLDEFREAFERFRAAATADAIAARETMRASAELTALYQKFDSEERALAQTVLSEWADSDDAGVRWSARDLIRAFRVVTAIESLQRSAARLSGSRDAPARYEVLAIQRLLKAAWRGLALQLHPLCRFVGCQQRQGKGVDAAFELRVEQFVDAAVAIDAA